MPGSLCMIHGQKLANEATKPSKLVWHIKTKHPVIKDKPLEFSERKKHSHKGQRQLLRATASINLNVLRALHLLANRIT